MRGKLTSMLTTHLGREVRLDGPLKLELSAYPKLVVGGLHLANAEPFTGKEFASLGEARLSLNLWALLRLSLQIDELSGSDVQINLQLNAHGKNNWTFSPVEQKQEVIQSPAAQQASNLELANLLTRLDIKRVSLEKLNIEFIGANSQSHYFELQTLVAHFPAGQPLNMILQGTVEKIHPYQLNLTGGTLGDLTHVNQPWPLKLTLDYITSHLTLSGHITGHSIALDHLSGIMGKTTLNGSLHLNFDGERPKIQGDLTLPVLDLRPFMTDHPVAKEKPPQNFAEVYQEIAKATFDINALNSADVDLTLHVGQWLSLPGAVHDAMLQVKLDHGHLSIPLQATVAEVVLSGSVDADASITPARFNLALGTHQSNLGNLAELFLGLPNIKGNLERFDFRMATQGNSGAALMEYLDVKLNIERAKLTYGNEAGKPPVQFSLDKLALIVPAGGVLQGEMHGTLLDKTFSASLHGDSMRHLMQEAHAPIDFKLQAGSARAHIHAVMQPFTENSGPAMDFHLTAPHSSEIASWFGLTSKVDAPLNLQGNFHSDKNSWHWADLALQLGHSNLSADMLRALEEGKPLIKFKLTGDLIDVEELHSLLPDSNKKASTGTPIAANIIDIPILPNRINLADADVIVRIKRIASNSPLVVRDLSFDGRLRDGMMSASPFAANVADTLFNGTLLLDLRTQFPHSVLQLSTQTIDVGSIMNKLGILHNIDASLDHLNLQMDLHSSHLGQLLEQSDLAIDFKGGHLILQDANTGSKMRIALDRGELKSAAKTPIYLNLFGSLDTIPVTIGIQTTKAVDLINPALPIPFKFNANTSGASIKLSGDIDRPFSKKDIELALDMQGSQLDNLNALTHTSLPPWGPWSVTGKFNLSSSGYEVSSLLLKVGSSQLAGHGKLDTTMVPPRIDVSLTAPTIQLDDFKFGDWSPEKNNHAPIEKEDSEKQDVAKQEPKIELSQKASMASNQAQHLLSPEVLHRQNASITILVDQVMSGQDILGSGKLDAQLENGHAILGPVVVNTPGGSASFRLGYKPNEKGVAMSLRAAAKHFDYGILARRVDKKNEMRGTMSFDVDVSARAPNLSEILRYGKGHIDFALWPENMKSGLLDIWAVNVLMALLPAIDSSHASKVNCAIGRFVLNDGKLSDKTILIDTSRMRVTGKGGVDFATENVDLYVQPRAKTPQFLSFAIPIEVSGNVNAFHIGVRTADVLESVGQLATSVAWVPLHMVLGKEVPADGHDVCAE